MNNNPYLQERLVELKQQEIQREMEQIRLLRQAGLSRPSLLSRAVNALRSFVKGEKRIKITLRLSNGLINRAVNKYRQG